MEFMDSMLHIIRKTYRQEAMCVNGSFDSQFLHLVKSTVNNYFRVQSSATCNCCLKGVLCICIFLVFNVEKILEMLCCKTRAARNSWSKGNIDRSKSALAETDKIKVYISRSKYREKPEMLSIKRVQFVILARNGISIVASVRWQLAETDKIFNNYSMSPRWI